MEDSQPHQCNPPDRRDAGKFTDQVGTSQERNRILRSLSKSDLALINPFLDRVPLKFRQCLQSPNRKIKAAYFPESGIASVVATSRGRCRRTEVGIIGCEGIVGVPLVHRTDRSPCEVFMQVEGEGKCISADHLGSVIDQSPSIRMRLLHYAHVFSVQAHYTGLANGHGKVEERLARWLLMVQDRLDTNELLLTHEFVALMLGVRRAGVTTALRHLMGRNLIATARGSVTILDRDGLEKSANGLYGEPEAEFERLFG